MRDQYEQIISFLNGQMSKQESVAFEKRIAEDKALAERVNLQKHLQAFLTDDGFSTFENALQAVKETYHTQINVDALLAADNDSNHPEGEGLYTLDDLLEMFKEVPHYEVLIEEEALAGIERAGGAEVIHPPSGTDCTGGKLTFELKEAMSATLYLSIEDSDEDEILREEISPDTKEFTIDVSHLKPGRYYWKLKSDDLGSVIRSFFIRKDMMPGELA